MKPVRELIIGKSGEETIRFNPTGHQILFAIEKAKAPGESDYELAKRAGVDAANPSKWAKKYGQLYLEWLEEFVEASHFSKQAEILEAVGMVHATQGQYSYWKDMARKHGVIQDEAKTLALTVNTDFTQILIGDPLEARRRILQEARGVVVQGGVGVAAPSGIGEQTSPGSGAGNVQDGPVEVLNALDTNRRQSEFRESVPVIPAKTSPSGSNRILAKRKIPPST